MLATDLRTYAVRHFVEGREAEVRVVEAERFDEAGHGHKPVSLCEHPAFPEVFGSEYAREHGEGFGVLP